MVPLHSRSSDGQASKQSTQYLRLAVEEDWPQVLELCRLFHSESPYRAIRFSEKSVRSIFDRHLDTPYNTVCLVTADANNEVTGIIVGAITPLPFSDVQVAGEIIWYVVERLRHTPVGRSLFDALEVWAKQLGAEFFHGVSTEGTTDLHRFYEHKGFSKAETIYYKVLN